MLKLNIGCGKKPLSDYDNLDIKNISGIKYPKSDTRNLPIKDNTYDEVLADWVLEHFGEKEIINILIEWRRVLKPKGCLKISTNYQAIINNCLFEKEISWDEWNYLTFGGETETYEGCHKIGLNKTILYNYLILAGFKEGEFFIKERKKCREADGRLKCPALIVEAYK